MSSAVVNGVSKHESGAGPNAFAESKVASWNHAGYARALTQHGINKATASGTATNDGYATSWASSRWADVITFDNPEFNGTRGQAELSFFYRYSFDTHATQYSTGAANFFMEAVVLTNTNRYANTYTDTLVNNGDGTYSSTKHQALNDLNGLRYELTPNMIYLTTDFIWGNAFVLDVHLNTHGQAHIELIKDGFASYSSDSFQSGYWAGARNVLSNGTLVTNYSLRGQSGTDYSDSFVPQVSEVPEPGPLALMIVAMMMLVFTRRRARPLHEPLLLKIFKL